MSRQPVVVVDLEDDDDDVREMAQHSFDGGRARSNVPPHSRRRPRSVVIDLTGDGNDVATPPPRRPRPALSEHRGRQPPAIDLTHDADDGEGDLVFVSAHAPPPPPPSAPAPVPRAFDAAYIPAGDAPLFSLFRRRAAPALQQLPQHMHNMRGARVMLHLPPLAQPPFKRQRTKKVRLERVARQPVEGSQCPICFEDMHEGDRPARTTRLVWCQYGCGASVHAMCMDEWKKARPYKNAPVACVLCRSDWKGWKEVPE